ncbi:5-hydroxytryptamine receptor 1D-like [Tubulanus polymorphus]|uniref:5-hydroxytryptamine receptor 1D-like n=1 Tax=Tubulanus polymorphus TaxID=672921 RepID=UPI003DA4150A
MDKTPKMSRNILAEQAVMTAAYGIIVLCGLVLNAWAALTISTRRQLRGSIYAFMISLAMADFLMDLLVLPWFIVAMWTDDWDISQPPWPMIITYLPMLISYLCWVLRFISVTSVLAIAISRYYVVITDSAHRTDKSNITVVAVVLIWWHGLLSTALPRMLSTPTSAVCLTTFALPSFMMDRISSFSESEYAVEVNVFIIYITTLMVIVYLYYKIRCHSSNSGSKYYVRRTTTNQMEQLRVQNEATVELLREGVVVIDETSAREVFQLEKSAASCQIISCYVILWMPYFAFNLFRAFSCGNKCNDNAYIYRYIDFATTWFTFLSTIVNPILYVLRNEQLKHDIKSLKLGDMDLNTRRNNSDEQQHLLEEIKYKAQSNNIKDTCRYERTDVENDDDDLSDCSDNEEENLISVSTINLHELDSSNNKGNNNTLSSNASSRNATTGKSSKNDETDSGLAMTRIRPHNRPQSPPFRSNYDALPGDAGSLPRGTSSSTSEFDDSDSSGVWLKSNGEESATIKPILKTFLPRVDEITLDRSQVDMPPKSTRSLPRDRRMSGSHGSEMIVVSPRVPRKNVNFVEPPH